MRQNKVLTFDCLEILPYRTTVWYEDRSGDNGNCQVMDLDFASETTYGQTWRVWLREPTEAEKAAHPWP